MPARRNRRPPADRPGPAAPTPTAAGKGSAPRRRPLTIGRSLRQLAIAAAGAVVGMATLGLLWPEPDRALAPTPEIGPASLAAQPARPVTLLVIGSDADRLGAPLNGAAPAGPANADALLLLRVNPDGPLQVLNLPTELAVSLPGEKGPKRLGEVYRLGGVALTADAVRELVGLESPKPDRYLVLPRGAFRDLVNGLGGLELSPPRRMRYTDKTQKLTIDLEAGLQQLGGAKVEHLVRFRDRWLGDAGRRSNQQLVGSSLRERMLQPDKLAKLPVLVTQLQAKVDTNLSQGETLSLLAAGLDTAKPVQFSSLPLKPAEEKHKGLRELEAGATPPLWKEPTP
ncbi:LCP family protein [Synechococcus sp. CCY 9618]|uniref:LCP family protein n=1 Tax=Synechococcus sp. CCY 9618 TaxID=2815602 RepID=UPI001C23B4A9|nr:LCP family protein [Synechococcus sp. CCY 9618]